MNAGLSNLSTLKAWLLAPAMQSSTDYDEQILTIGRGVAAQLERHCNRKFARTVAAEFICPADIDIVVLPRMPIEAAPTVELRGEGLSTWVAQSSPIAQWSAESGLVELSSQLGTIRDRLRFTYTGGYFFEQLEPVDSDYPTAIPSGATSLPDDILLAWQLQCEHVWTQRDKLGLQLGKEPTATPAIAQLRLLDVVTEQLRAYVRYSL